MINAITSGISVAIGEKFGDGYEIYTESIEQGLKEPCFSIVCINPTSNLFLGKRYFRTNQFCIHYFPHSNDKRSECMNVLETLYDILEWITVDGDLVRGSEMHGELSDGVLNFFVNYDMFIYKKGETEQVMESVEYNADVKG